MDQEQIATILQDPIPSHARTRTDFNSADTKDWEGNKNLLQSTESSVFQWQISANKFRYKTSIKIHFIDPGETTMNVCTALN